MCRSWKSAARIKQAQGKPSSFVSIFPYIKFPEGSDFVETPEPSG